MSETPRTYAGQCYCGATKVNVTGEPFASGYCHCASCRSFHGAPFMAWAAWSSDAVRVEGTLRKTDKTPGLARSTCATCGGKVAGILTEAGVTVVFPSVLAESEFAFRPEMHKNYEARVVDIVDGLPKFVDGPEALGGSGETVAEVRAAQ